MPLYQIDIEKKLGDEYWTNVYYVERDDLAAANTDAGFIAGAEANMHLVSVQFTKARIRSAIQGDEIYVTRPLNFLGTRSLENNPLLPLFNVIRVDFAAVSGRPSRKFYRACLLAGHLTGVGNLTNAIILTAQGAVDGLFGAGGMPGVPLRDVDGQALTSASVFQAVGMRQLRRGSKRRTTPVLPG